MRTRKQELVSNDLKPFVCNILKSYREKYNYSLEDLSRAIGYKKKHITQFFICLKTDNQNHDPPVYFHNVNLILHCFF